jgi:hypothetical protein
MASSVFHQPVVLITREKRTRKANMLPAEQSKLELNEVDAASELLKRFASKALLQRLQIRCMCILL